MVEFGLKLQDNKVQEWSDKYIDYEKLKHQLQLAKKASKARELHEEKHENASVTFPLTSFTHDHETRLGLPDGTPIVDQTPDIIREEKELRTSGSVQSVSGSMAEKSPLLKRNRSYQSNLSALGSDIIGSVGNFFQRQSYPSKLEELLDAENLAIFKFSTFIREELDKVNDFYNEEIGEIEKRLNLLKDMALESLPEMISEPGQPPGNSKITASIRRRLSSIVMKTNSECDEDSDEEMKDGTEINKQSIEENRRELESIQRSLSDLHRRTKLLGNFSIMNVTGFIKIVKKFHKTFKNRRQDFRAILQDNSVCGNGSVTTEIALEMEKLFADWFCQGNITEARAKLLAKKGDGLEMDWSQLRLGYRLGMCSVLAVWVCWDCIWDLVKNGQTTIGSRTAFPVFRACGGLLVVHWFWGISVYVWSRYRVNYIYLFEFDPRIVNSPITILEKTTDETLVFLILMLLYYKADSNEIPKIISPGYYPFFLVMFTLKCLFTPTRTRGPLWKGIGAVICAPLVSPTFFHTYIGDVFTSMVKVFQDIAWTGCFILSGDFLIMDVESNKVEEFYSDWQSTHWYKDVVIPLICLAPLWIRFNQCLRRYMDTGKRMPYLANAFKYALSQTVTLFGAFHPIYLFLNRKDNVQIEAAEKEIQVDVVGNNIFQLFWMGLFVSSSLYSFFWDVYVDWGLGRVKYRGLGDRLMFPNPLYYYLVMVVDLFLRFMWVLTLVPPQSGARFELPNYLTAFTMVLELFRRTIWGFFRLENEHRSNSSGFRRVEFVPLHFSTGHSHKYDNTTEHNGWRVLGEVITISILVIGISAGSVISAQKASKGLL